MLRLVEIVLNKLSWAGGGWAGVAGSNENKANLSQPAKLELGLGLSLAKPLLIQGHYVPPAMPKGSTLTSLGPKHKNQRNGKKEAKNGHKIYSWEIDEYYRADKCNLELQPDCDVL